MRAFLGLLALTICGCAGESAHRAMSADDPANPDAEAGVIDVGSETLVVREAPATMPAGQTPSGGHGGHHHAH